MGLVLGRLLAVVAVVVSASSCERHQPVVIGFAFGTATPSELDLVRPGGRDSVSGATPKLVDAAGMIVEPGPPGQVTMASRFVAMPGIVAVVGHGDSRSTLAAAPVYDEAHVPLLVPTATSRRLRTVSPWVFMLAPDDSAEAAFITRFVVESLRARTAAVFYENDEYGIGLRDFLRTALAARHARVTAEEPIGSFCEAEREGGGADASLVRATPRDRPPGVVIIAGRNLQAACIGQRVHERLAGTPIVAGDGVEPDSSFLAAIDDAARDFFVVAFWHPGAPGSRSEAFAHRFEAAMGRPPRPSSALVFDAMSLIEAAVKEVGAGHEAVRRYLTELGRSRPSYQGVTGTIAFGDVQRPLYMLRVAGPAGTPVFSQ